MLRSPDEHDDQALVLIVRRLIVWPVRNTSGIPAENMLGRRQNDSEAIHATDLLVD